MCTSMFGLPIDLDIYGFTIPAGRKVLNIYTFFIWFCVCVCVNMYERARIQNYMEKLQRGAIYECSI